MGVPFILMTGKKLDERNNYVKITFKDNIYCVPSEDDESVEQVGLNSLLMRMNRKLGLPITDHIRTQYSRAVRTPSLPAW